MKELVLAAKKVAGRKAGECDHDDQLVDWHCKRDSPSSEGYFTCPTCARLREIAKYKWMDEYPRYPYGCSTVEMICANTIITEPFTVQSVRALLEDLGEWDGFIRWHVWQLHKFKEPRWGKSAGMVWLLDFHLSHSASADILTTDEYIVQAATEYLEGLNEQES